MPDDENVIPMPPRRGNPERDGVQTAYWFRLFDAIPTSRWEDLIAQGRALMLIDEPTAIGLGVELQIRSKGGGA